MNQLRVIAIVLMIGLYSCNPGKKPNKESVKEEVFHPFVERIDPGLDKIMNASATVKTLLEGFDWVEGPLWIDGLGLLFSDIPKNSIYLWNEHNGVKLYLKPSGYTGDAPRLGETGSNALLLDSDGNLVLCQHGDRRLARMDAPINNPNPEFTTIVGEYLTKKFNSPNDACYNSTGDLYFTDPPYGLEKRMKDPSKELSYQGVFKYDKSGQLHLLTKDLSRPNGIALSPDEKTLYIANSDPKSAIWVSCDLDENGLIKTTRIFYEVTDLVDTEQGLPDGLKVDARGNIFATGPGGVWIFNAQGKVLGKIRTGQATSNCAFGEDGKSLFITADDYVMMVDLIS